MLHSRFERHCLELLDRFTLFGTRRDHAYTRRGRSNLSCTRTPFRTDDTRTLARSYAPLDGRASSCCRRTTFRRTDSDTSPAGVRECGAGTRSSLRRPVHTSGTDGQFSQPVFRRITFSSPLHKPLFVLISEMQSACGSQQWLGRNLLK